MGTKLGERLQEERKRLKMNQSSFGEKVGVLRKTQSNYETDTRKPDSDYLRAAAQIGVDVQYVVTGCRSSDMPSSGGMVVGEEAASYSTGTSREETELLKLFRNAPAEIKQAVLRVLGG